MTVETVTSKDGTRIACVRRGHGPPLVLVPGVTGDHTHFTFLAPLLEPHFDLWMVHRRGRGESGDGPVYAIEREFEDVATVIDSIGGPVHVFGHSFGADVVLGAMTRTPNIARAVVYEPSLGLPSDDPTLPDELDALEARGDRKAMLMRFHRDMPADAMREYRASQDFTRDLALAHTMAREVRAGETWPFDAAETAAARTTTLLLVGAESPDWVRRATDVAHAGLPDSRLVVLEGHGHVAMWTEPGLVARLIVEFLLHERASSPTSR